MQQCIRDLLKEEGLEQDSDDPNEEQKDPDCSTQTKKRGRPFIPERWTRVISVHNDDLSQIQTYELASDLILDSSVAVVSHTRGRPPQWNPIFWPPHVKKQNIDKTIAGNELDREALQQLGEKLS